LTEIAYKQERVGDFIQIYSGKLFYVLDPRAEDMDVISIAHSLSNLARFTGHSERFYTVGEHSVRCARMARKAGYSVLQQLYCLGHDASESVMNDLARPVKQNVPQYKKLEDEVMEVMWDVMKLPKPTEEDYKIVKAIDNTMLIHELEQLMKRSTIDYENLEHIKVFEDMTYGYGAGESKHDFLSMYYALMNEYQEELMLNEG
jgi:uncharacterized protein